jgi:ABC-type dipeptide/oligopeptide/nickel transport system permease component
MVGLFGPALLHRRAGDRDLLGLDTDRRWWWLPSIYDTTHEVDDWDSFVFQLQQMVMPVMVLGLRQRRQISRYMRASMLDNLQQDYVRTARAKGMGERVVVLRHVLRNSLIPVVTVIALACPRSSAARSSPSRSSR